uniref:Beta-microseminoprotein n=1 Tax=Crocodylus porosus TaxID=8502 RepID=A0A7M4DVT6_CROPO
MKLFLGIILAFGISVTLCRSQCFFYPLRGNPAACYHNGVRYQSEDTWQARDCLQCTCSSTGVQCCKTISYPTNYDRVNCIAIRNWPECSFRIVRKLDRSMPCEVTGVIS